MKDIPHLQIKQTAFSHTDFCCQSSLEFPTEEINFLCWTIFEYSKRIILFQKSIDIQLNYIRMGITYNWILNINYFESCFNEIVVKTYSDLFLPRFVFGLLQIHLSDEKEKASHFSSSLISKIVSQGFGLISHYF